MAEPIKNKRLDDLASAPTPQNTPANSAPITSHAAQPREPAISEEDGAAERAAAAGVFAQNPQLVSMIQGKLNTLVGRSSGYIESLPADVRRRITGLKGMQKKHAKLEAQFQEEILQLEKRYAEKYKPLYTKRAGIISGAQEPSEEEVDAGRDGEVPLEEVQDETATGVSGIPEFWLTAMKNHLSLAETIHAHDEEALKHLLDIRMTYLDKPGFKLCFDFAENDFFENKTVTKSYYYQDETGYAGDFIYDHAEGDQIQWKLGKNLTVRLEQKKQRNKKNKQTRIITKEVPQDSFFNFFSPPIIPSDESSEDAGSDIDERLELDYQLGEDIKEKLIPRAVDWYTGAALAYEEIDDELAGEEYEDEDDEEEEESEQEELSDESEDEVAGKPGRQEPSDCKQS